MFQFLFDWLIVSFFLKKERVYILYYLRTWEKQSYIHYIKKIIKIINKGSKNNRYKYHLKED